MTTNQKEDENMISSGEMTGIYGAEKLGQIDALEGVVGNKMVAMRILQSFGSLLPLASASTSRLMEIKGVGKGGARRIQAAFAIGEIAERLRVVGRKWSELIRDPSVAASIFRKMTINQEQECFMIIGLNARMRMIVFRTIAMGSASSVDVHPRELFRPMIENGVHSILLGHNHPSGCAEPSEADFELTRRISEAGRLLGIPVLDHVIVTHYPPQHYSLAADTGNRGKLNVA